MKKQLFFSAALHVLSTGVAWAQAQLIATADRYQISLDDRLRVSFSCQANGKNFQPPDWGGEWEVQMGPALSQSTTIIQGRVKSEISYQFIIRPKKKGSLNIGPARIFIDGIEQQSKTLTIEVSDSESGASNQNSPQKPPAAFFRVEPSRSSVYVGEPLMLDYTFYYQPSVQQLSGDEKIKLNGFYSKDLEIPEAGKRGSRTIDGLQYQWALSKRVMLIPQLKDARIEGYVELQGVDLSGGRTYDPFNWSYQRGRSFKERRNAPAIAVKALPDKGRPADFSGAVGRFVLRAKIDRETAESGDPVRLKIEVEGKGNLGLIELHDPELPAQIEAFEPERKDRLTVGSTGFSGSKTLEILLIPRHKGTYKIPPYRFSFFDPEKAEYTILSSEELSFEVLSGEAATASSATGSAEEVQTVVEDIRYLRSSDRNFGQTSPGPLWFLLLLIPPALGFSWGEYGRRKLRFSPDSKRMLIAEALHSISRSKQEFKPENALSFLERFQLEVLGLKASELSRPRTIEAFTSAGYPAETAERFMSLKEKWERSRFSGAVVRAEDIEDRKQWMELWSKL